MILDNLRNQSKTDDIGEVPEVSNELKNHAKKLNYCTEILIKDN